MSGQLLYGVQNMQFYGFLCVSFVFQFTDLNQEPQRDKGVED